MFREHLPTDLYLRLVRARATQTYWAAKTNQWSEKCGKPQGAAGWGCWLLTTGGSATSSLYPELTLNMLFDKYLSMLFLFFYSKPEKELFLFFYLWCNYFFSPRQERLPERGEDPVSLEGPEHNQAAGSVCEQWSALHGHRIHGVWRLEPVFVPTSASGQNWAFTQYANHQVGHANKCTHILKNTHRRTQSNSFYFLPSVISSLQLPSAHFHGQPDCVRNEVPLLA